jgi:uncharacterized membrane protein YgaE (UPF0421/DUF939 family)
VGLLTPIQAQREVTRETFAESLVYAAQAVAATLLIFAAYGWAGRTGGVWAAVSAVLVLQPGFRRSLAASAIRVIANLLGAGVGIAAGLEFADRSVSVCVALVIIILTCEVAKLDAGVRSACASVMIVSMGSGTLYERGMERATAVAIGCGAALALQLVTQPAVHYFRRGVALGAGRDGTGGE